MQPIATPEIKRRVERDNPWWNVGADPGIPEAALLRRVYFASFKSLALNFEVRRAAILLGPRRVGKTVLIKQLIHESVAAGINPRHILYASIDAPVYSGISLERFLDFFPEPSEGARRLVVFDEIQYLKDWEVHLKDLVDQFPRTKFIGSGSAAAALRLKSTESGAGRFTDFMLPPLTFFEFLQFIGADEELVEEIGPLQYAAKDLDALNGRFVDYLNYGGYPEVALNEQVRADPDRFVRSDIIDKVLLKDLPSLYGINEIQELNKLFSFLAYNAGAEASLENIARESGLAKPTIKKYIEYLESAFLVLKLPTVDDNCRTMKRERSFKVYLNNPSMRAALFAPVRPDESARIGHLAECAIFAQWQHSPEFRQLRFARWRNEGEVDIVYLRATDDRPLWAGEIKWSDTIKTKFGDETRSLAHLLRKHESVRSVFFTTRTIHSKFALEGRDVTVLPSALYCYTIGRNVALQSGRLEETPQALA